jgi:hypothetical protein
LKAQIEAILKTNSEEEPEALESTCPPSEDSFLPEQHTIADTRKCNSEWLY